MHVCVKFAGRKFPGGTVMLRGGGGSGHLLLTGTKTATLMAVWMLQCGGIFFNVESWEEGGFKPQTGGRNSSVGSARARCPQRRGFDPPLGTVSGSGDFSLGVNMGSNSIHPKNSFG